jgi:RHS repeat-associated protein
VFAGGLRIAQVTATEKRFLHADRYDARLYDPVIGWFSSVDSIMPQIFGPQSYNRYSYVLNNPLIYLDLKLMLFLTHIMVLLEDYQPYCRRFGGVGLSLNLEWFNSDDPDENAIVTDKNGRSVS